MTNLEELTLLLSILRVDSNYVDGVHLYDEILIPMPRLNKFTFSIVSQTVNKNIKIDLPSNDNIQSSFIERGYNQVGSYADFNSTTNVGRCHVFSLPYRFEIFINLNNFFTGGIFNKVRCLFMNDTSSFEHELFALVSQAFPYLEKLYVYNFQAQKNKQHSSTLIVFSHLVKLILSAVHVDYAEQFLFEKNTRLPRLLELTIEYETLAIVTNNFTNDAARLNCVNLQNIHIEGSFVRPESFHHYFPLLIGGCTFDRPLLGEFYSYENGLETHTSLKENGVVDRRSYRRESGAGATRKDGGDLLVTQDLGHCYQLTVRQNYYELIYRDEDKSCFQCYQMFNRTKNVIQIRKSSCEETTSLSTNQMNFDDLCRTIDEQSEFITLFSKSYSAEECRRTIYGTYHFTYEFREGGIGICDNPSSRLISCPDPGTPFEAVNERFRMKYGYCKYLTSSFDADQLNQCLGSWSTPDGNIITAIANERVGSERWYDKFRCMLSRKDQPQWFAKSLFAECSSLSSPTDGPEKVIITPIIPEEPIASCFFPSNLTGQWINTANVNARVLINATHIHEIAKVNNRGWLRETYYVCQQTSRSQYLVKAVTKGECFSYYICFDFKDRHHNILRYRKSKSFMSNLYKLFPNRDPFYEVCSWTSFGNDANWKYQAFVLDPPAPIECPFTGMWTFKQVEQSSSLIQTRIRGGVTPRPRDHGWYITCDPQYVVSQWTICGDQTKSMFADREYCRQLDPYGTPIGVYEQPDYIYQCAGYWREDSRSMMVTYDRDDPYNNFKCWVYERRDLTSITLSRSAGSACGFNQTSESYKAEDGADLAITLTEAERIHDDCPIRYDDGRNVFVDLEEFNFYYGKSSVVQLNKFFLSFLFFLLFILFN
ncbi:unnamed protein product [Rotaria socialis]